MIIESLNRCCALSLSLYSLFSLSLLSLTSLILRQTAYACFCINLGVIVFVLLFCLLFFARALTSLVSLVSLAALTLLVSFA